MKHLRTGFKKKSHFFGVLSVHAYIDLLILFIVLLTPAFRDETVCIIYTKNFFSVLRSPNHITRSMFIAEPHKQPIYGKQKETHELIFSWLSWLAVLLVSAYARRQRRRRSRATWRPYSKQQVDRETCSFHLLCTSLILDIHVMIN